MAAIAPKEASHFLRSGYEKYAVILLFGADAGLISERCEQIALSVTGGDRGNILRLEGDEIASHSGRLADEAYAITMFGGRRAIWIRAGGKSIQTELAVILGQPPSDAVVIIEAGDLRKSSPLRSLIEKTSNAAALACYAEDTREVIALAEEMAAANQMTLSAESREAISAQLGGDRKRSRSELEKLFLYCHGQTRVEAEDIDQCLTDAAALSSDRVVDAAFQGKLESVDGEARRNFADGMDAAVLLGAALRHALLLRDLLDQSHSEPIARLVASPRNNIHWRRQRAVAEQLERWSQPRLDKAISIIGEAVLSCRREPRLAAATAIRTLWSLGLAVNKRG